jgi:hypothetical protein
MPEVYAHNRSGFGRLNIGFILWIGINATDRYSSTVLKESSIFIQAIKITQLANSNLFAHSCIIQSGVLFAIERNRIQNHTPEEP